MDLDGDGFVGNDVRSLGFVLGVLDVWSPVMTVEREWAGVLKRRFVASVVDPLPSGGIDRVEFYVDDVLEEVLVEDVFVSEGVYEWVWCGVGNHSVMVVVFDCAGNGFSRVLFTSLGVDADSSEISVSSEMLTDDSCSTSGYNTFFDGQGSYVFCGGEE